MPLLSAFSHIRYFISVLWGPTNILYGAKYWSQIICFESSQGLSRNVTKYKLNINKFWRQFNIKMANFTLFPFLLLIVISGDKQENKPVCNESPLVFFWGGESDVVSFSRRINFSSISLERIQQKQRLLWIIRTFISPFGRPMLTSHCDFYSSLTDVYFSTVV